VCVCFFISWSEADEQKFSSTFSVSIEKEIITNEKVMSKCTRRGRRMIIEICYLTETRTTTCIYEQVRVTQKRNKENTRIHTYLHTI